MKKFIFFITLLYSFKSLAQNDEKIKINNSRITFSIDVGGSDPKLELDGQSKYYNELKNNNPNIVEKSGFCFGSNVEYHIFRDSRKASAGMGLHFFNFGHPIFISEGDLTNLFPKEITDSVGLLRMQKIRVPLYFQARLFRLSYAWNVGFETGLNFDYLLNAVIKPGKLESEYSYIDNPQISEKTKVTNAFVRVRISPYLGVRLILSKIYVFGRFSFPAKKIFTNSYANYAGENRFEQSLSAAGIGLYLR